ncbi:MAG TPA: hypothetical protein VEI03_24435 [Stellaceae bacterium]|nr:hypothetical protein [Stellaceae bacterium]
MATDLADILNRLADVDHDLLRLEGGRALAQTAADSAEVSRLDVEIGHLMKLKEELRAQWRRERR